MASLSKQENKKVSKIAFRAGGRLAIISVAFNLLPSVLLLAPMEDDAKQKALQQLVFILSVLLQLIAHFIVARLKFYKWLFHPKYENRLTLLVEKRTIKGYFWRWYGFSILCLIGMAAVIAVMNSITHTTGGMGIVVYTFLNIASFNYIIHRLIRDGKTSLHT